MAQPIFDLRHLESAIGGERAIARSIGRRIINEPRSLVEDVVQWVVVDGGGNPGLIVLLRRALEAGDAGRCRLGVVGKLFVLIEVDQRREVPLFQVRQQSRLGGKRLEGGPGWNFRRGGESAAGGDIILQGEPHLLQIVLARVSRAASRAACTAGSNSATSTPMMAITTNSSTKVKPLAQAPLSF